MTVERTRSGPVLSPLTWRRSFVLLAAVVGALALLIAALVLAVRLVPGVQPLPLVAWLAPGHALLVLGVIAALLRRWRLSFADLGFRRPTARLLHLVWQIPSMLVLLIVVQGLATALLGSRAGTSDVQVLLQDGAKGLVPVAAVGVVVLVPIWEETVFRGVIRGGLLRRFPAWFAVVASALLFAAAHAVPLLLPYLFTAGVCLALLVRFHRTLWASVIAHASLNALVLFIALQATTGR